jgi:hypothetical protein
VRGAATAQLPLAVADLVVELVDQRQAGRDRRRPRLGQLEPFEQTAAAGAEEVAMRVGQAVLEEDRVDAVLQRASVLDQVQAETRSRDRGSSRLAAASRSRSLGRSCGRPACRRNTESSCRSTISSSLKLSERGRRSTSSNRQRNTR